MNDDDTKARRGRAARLKGHSWERKLVHLFRAVMPGVKVQRGLGQTRGGAAECPDVDAGGIFSIEAKVGKRPPVRRALATAIETAPKGSTGIAVIKEDHKPPYVVIGLEDFLELVREWHHGRTR
jgi:hypothetical protein